MSEQLQYYQGTGRRKSAVARVRLFPRSGEGSGEIIVNGKKAEDYFGPRVMFHSIIQRPFQLTDTVDQFDTFITVRGGGVSGQVGAVSLAVTRALMHSNIDLRPTLKKAGLVTRDAREKERKKAGLKRARKRPQYTKR